MVAAPSFAERAHALSLKQFADARGSIREAIVETPLLVWDEGLRLKPENLQPRGSFKLRAATAAIMALSPEGASKGVATASAGNFALGLAVAARARGLHLTVHVPDTAAAAKVVALRALGADIVILPFADWWQVMTTRLTGRDDGVFLHPVCELEVLLGNGTIALEILEQWPDVEAIYVPVGGGGLLSGIALALRAAGRSIRVVACEIETAAPLSASVAAGHSVKVNMQPSFVDGIGSGGLLDDMWPLLRDLADEVVTISEDEAKDAIADLALTAKIVVEGAGAVPFAAARRSADRDRSVAILSGGNINARILSEIVSERAG